MEAALGLQSYNWIGSEKGGRKTSGGILKLSNEFAGERRVRALGLEASREVGLSIRTARVERKVSSCCKNNIYNEGAGSENLYNSADGAKTLRRKSKDVLPYLNGRCLYLVGMMGSGKTTVGKILAEVLGYSFFDSDKLAEKTVGASSVAEIFKEHSEAFFREIESKVLRELSSMHCLVVATGGGAVIRPINWSYMKQGISVWLDVPLDVLAKRIAAVGTASRPLLNEEPGDSYTKAFIKLRSLSEQRGKAYENADARVCLETLAANHGHVDISLLTPSDIALEALLKIESYLLKNSNIIAGTFRAEN